MIVEISVSSFKSFQFDCTKELNYSGRDSIPEQFKISKIVIFGTFVHQGITIYPEN